MGLPPDVRRVSGPWPDLPMGEEATADGMRARPTSSRRSGARRTGLTALLVLGCVVPGEDDPDEPTRTAQFEVFEVKLVPPSASEPLVPTQKVVCDVDYKGDLANPPQLTAVIVAPDGRTVRRPMGLAAAQQSRVFREGRGWFVRDDLLKQPGRFELFFEVSVRATLRGSEPWLARTNSLFLDLQTALDGVRLTAPTGQEPIAYGTPLGIEIGGRDLWDPVAVTLVDEAGTAIADEPVMVPFDINQRSRPLSWRIRARPIERVGSHPVRLLATFGELQRLSDPFLLTLSHTIDTVVVLRRDPGGAIGPVPDEAPLHTVAQLMMRVRGTQLAGHPLSVNGAAPIVAAADEVELTVEPRDDDFASGKGTHTYAYTVESGGIERSARAVLRRWAITDCGWFASDGRRFGSEEHVRLGESVYLRTTTWGFPDTKTTLGIFKDRTATFTVMEDDSGRDEYLAGGSPDEVEELDADIRSNQAEKTWTTVFDEDPGVPFLDFAHAEMYFDVRIEEESCRSTIIRVPEKNFPDRP